MKTLKLLISKLVAMLLHCLIIYLLFIFLPNPPEAFLFVLSKVVFPFYVAFVILKALYHPFNQLIRWFGCHSYYGFTGATKQVDGVTLHQIVCKKAIYCTGKDGKFSINVNVGEIGGWIQSKCNLTDYAWVAADAVLYSSAIATNHAYITGNVTLKHTEVIGCSVDGNGILEGISFSGNQHCFVDGRYLVTQFPLREEAPHRKEERAK